MIGQVIAQEAPVRNDLLVERIARAHGFKRSGRLIRDRVMTLVRGAAHVETESDGAAFIWPDQLAFQTWNRPRYPATSADVRAAEQIALPELSAALRACRSDDPIAEAARAFGLKRVGPAVRERLKQAMQAEGHFRE